jgi:GT2 family glycosyltransferase
MKLSVVLGTFNRLDQLQRCVSSILEQTRTPTVVYITDAGSTDGTVEYLQAIASENVVPVLVGKKLGQAKAYNDVFMQVQTEYVCWLSDDNEVINNGLDRAVRILDSDASIGMVGLKTRDKQGPFVGVPYIGGISEAGILNVNQGMLRTSLLKKVGGFSEKFRDYGIDPALTAEVLLTGYKVVYTKLIALNHYRNWSEDPQSENYQWLKERNARARKLYQETYVKDGGRPGLSFRIKSGLGRFVKAQLVKAGMADFVRNSRISRDMFNILFGKYISIVDPLLSWGKECHLVQYMPESARPDRRA